MKTINNLFLIIVLTLFQFCKSQDVKKYANDYNKVTPKLKILAIEKRKFYGKDFSELLKEINKKRIEIVDFSFRGKTDISEQIYIVRLRLYNRNDFDMAIENNYQLPVIQVYFKEQIPDEIKTLTRKYEGQLTPEVREFLSNREIEKIEFYGINGLKSKDRTVR